MMLNIILLLFFGIFPVDVFAQQSYLDCSPNCRLGSESFRDFGFSGDYVRLLSGFEPERLDGQTLILHPGLVADLHGELSSSKKKLTIDVTTHGIGGLETEILTEGVSYHVFLVRNKIDLSLNAIISPKISGKKLNLPEPFEVVRKLPWGFVPINGSIPAFHLSYWPKPFTRFTDASSSALWGALLNGDSTEFSTVDFSRWIPENARMVYLLIEVGSRGTIPGNAIIRVGGSKGEGLVVGKSFGAAGTILTLHQRINSSRKIVYKVTGDAVLNIYVLGYSNTEPS